MGDMSNIFFINIIILNISPVVLCVFNRCLPHVSLDVFITSNIYRLVKKSVRGVFRTDFVKNRACSFCKTPILCVFARIF